MTFPSHQGLILPVVRRWPNSFDALALSVGAAMPDITDTILGFLINGYFKQWYGHALIGIFTLDFLGGLVITWLIAVAIRRLLKFSFLFLWGLFLCKPHQMAARRQPVTAQIELNSACGVFPYSWASFPTLVLISYPMIRIYCFIPGMKTFVGFQDGGTGFGLNYLL
jgi:hypothetical protein